MLKVIHCADIHLDAPFSLSKPAESERRRSELRSAFSSLVMYAKDFGADIFIIAGDFFDDSFITKDTAKLICREIASFPECKFFITPGNHDPYHENSPYNIIKWPENVHIFKDEALSFVDIPEKNARIYGLALKSNTLSFDPFENLVLDDSSKTNILIAHGFVDTSAELNLFNREKIAQMGFDYIALGHVHNCEGILGAGNTKYAYSGVLEGRSFDETGYKGALVGTIDKNCVEMKGVRFSKKRYEKVYIDISGTDKKEEVIEKIKAETKEFLDDTSLRIYLTGVTYADALPSANEIKSIVCEPAFVEVIDNTTVFIDEEGLENDKTLIGAFYRKLLPKLKSEDEEERKIANLALKYGLSALSGNDIGESF